MNVTVADKPVQYQALAGCPAAKYRIFNAANLADLTLRSDVPIQPPSLSSSIPTKSSSDAIPGGSATGQIATASSLKSKKFGISLTTDAIRADASLQDVSNLFARNVRDHV